VTRIPSPLRTLAWSIYLGMSWTWCVGMFVTVALYREFGFAAWVAVTIPNVIGAASVGFTFARPGARSDAVVARHRQAVVGFSAITLAFHAFFLFWLARAGLIPTVAAAAVAIGLAIGLVNRRDIRVDLLLGVAVLAVSAVVLIHGLAHVGRAVLAPPDPPRTPTAMAALAVACVFGFLTCPYLDVTFHRACQSLPPNPKRVAFAVGLGVVFLSMIAGTTLYAGDFNRGFTGAFTLAGLTTWVAAHLCVQTGYKWAVHLRALPPWRPTDALIWAFALTTAALSAVGLIAHVTLGFHAYDDLILPGQVYYRIFTSFYGLLFPAYVWLCMVPLPGRPAPGPTKQSLTVLAVAVVIATPMYWLGFLADQWAWIPVGVAILLAARLFVRSAETSATDERR
jgi:hypothetical protein